MKKLTLTLRYDSRLAESEWESSCPSEPMTIFFEEHDSGEEIAFEDVDKGSLKKARTSLLAFYFLMAVTSLARKNPSKAEELLSQKGAADLLGEKNLYNVVTRKGRSAQWLVTIFGENPNNKYLLAKDLSVRFSDGFDGGEKILLCVERGAGGSKGKELSDVELETFCQNRLKPKETLHLHKVAIDLDFIRANGESFVVSNRGHHRYIEWHDSFWVKVYSNYPDYFCVFWIDALARVYELYPDSTIDLKKKHYVARFNKYEDATSELSFPFNSTLSIDSHRGVENCIVLTASHPFKRDEVNQMKKRLRILMKNDVYCRSGNEYDSFEKYLAMEKLPAVEEENIVMELEATPSLAEWREKIVSQMNGFASKIHFLQLAHLPRPI